MKDQVYVFASCYSNVLLFVFSFSHQYFTPKHYDYLCNNLLSYRSLWYQSLPFLMVKNKLLKLFFSLLHSLAQKNLKGFLLPVGFFLKKNQMSSAFRALCNQISPKHGPQIPHCFLSWMYCPSSLLTVIPWFFAHILPMTPSWILLLLYTLPRLSHGSWLVPALEYA